MRPRDQLQGQIEAWWQEFVRSHPPGYCRAAGRPILSQETDDFDADSFLRGLERGLFWIEHGYQLLSHLRATRQDGEPSQFHFFEKVATGACQLRQESIPHYGAAAELILDYEWPPEQVVIESPPVAELTAGALDLAVFADEGRGSAFILGEAKALKSQLRKMLSGLRSCGGAADRAHAAMEHKKCLGILTFRPQLFLGVCGGQRLLYPVAYRGTSFRLEDDVLDLESMRAPTASIGDA